MVSSDRGAGATLSFHGMSQDDFRYWRYALLTVMALAPVRRSRQRDQDPCDQDAKLGIERLERRIRQPFSNRVGGNAKVESNDAPISDLVARQGCEG